MIRFYTILFLAALAAPAATYYVTVAGLGGEPDYDQRFEGWAKEIGNILKGAPDANSVVLSGPRATRESLRKELDSLAGQTSAEDAVVVMLIGHGTHDGSDYKLNLPGPDITASELASRLAKLPAKRQLIVNMTSASGGALPALAKQDRVVITATKSGTEKNATVFTRYWVEALRDPAADTDKNEVISALEAYRYASRKTADFYTTEKRIATEHSQLDDTGAGKAERNPEPANGTGQLAAAFPLVRFGAAQEAAKDPANKTLIDRKQQLEQEIDRLKYRKAAMPLENYKKQLSALLLELAQTQEKLEQ